MSDKILDLFDAMHNEMAADRDEWKAKAERYYSIVDKIISVLGKLGAITDVEVQDILRAELQEDTP